MHNFKDVFQRRVLPSDLALIFVVFNEHHASIRDARKPSPDQIIQLHAAGGFDLSRMLCYMDNGKEIRLGLLHVTGHDIKHGYAEGSIYNFGRGYKEKAYFTLALAQAALTLHLEEKIYTFTSDIILPNLESEQFTYKTMGFNRLGIISKLYCKDGLLRDCLCGYGNFKTTYEHTAKLRTKGIWNDAAESVFRRADTLYRTLPPRHDVCGTPIIDIPQLHAVAPVGNRPPNLDLILRWSQENQDQFPFGPISIDHIRSMPPDGIYHTAELTIFPTFIDSDHHYMEIGCQITDTVNNDTIARMLVGLAEISLSLNVRNFIWRFPATATKAICLGKMAGFKFMESVPDMYVINGKRYAGHCLWINRQGIIDVWRKAGLTCYPGLIDNLKECADPVNGFF